MIDSSYQVSDHIIYQLNQVSGLIECDSCLALPLYYQVYIDSHSFAYDSNTPVFIINTLLSNDYSVMGVICDFDRHPL